jgi:drug/metabolite transporter (DMT)-like permease
MKGQETRLRNALKANMIFSFLSGAGLAIFSSAVSAFMEVERSDIFVYIGIGLLLFSFTIAWSAFAKEFKIKRVKLITMQDWAWILGSAVLLVLNPWNISLGGNILIAIFAVIVMLLLFFKAVRWLGC